jgi:diadenosine tetraphosphatase ApaH/serine/threonine PP2A family protein phosphatase
MRVLVVSDIHSNLVALDAVLAAVGDVDAVWSLGDVVGYGPRPNECIDRLRERDALSIPGNHDWGVLGKADLGMFNPDARQANLWNRAQLRPASRAYLEGLEETRVEGAFTLAHGSPRAPIWEYLVYPDTARENFQHFETKVCLVGHTHVPALFYLPPDADRCTLDQLPEGESFPLEEGRYILNPGSVGQPRDGDPRAAFLLIDTEALIVEQRRVAYDIEETQRAMRQAELPYRLSARLEMGW